MRFLYRILMACLCLGPLRFVFAVEPPRLCVPRVHRAPVLVDFLEGRPREAEAVVKTFRQFGPRDGDPASQDSIAYLSYDDANLYVAWVCKQDPKTLRAHLMKRDTIFNEDRVSVSLDTFHDHHRSYWFDVNPYGVQMDGVTVDGQDDVSFDTVWRTDGRITADGYVVLITIPFRAIRFPGRPVQEWGIALNRLIPGNNEMSSWPYITPKVQGWSTQFAHLDGLEGITNGHNLVLVPYTMARRSRNLDLDTGDFAQKSETRMGLDAKWVLKDALSLDMTINPDFSQVESDEPQVTVNQRYEVFYPEKRPFFLENANLFQTPVNLFFSRRIADPSAGIRLSGKAEAWGIGALIADDRADGEKPDLEAADRGRRTGIGVLRVFREFENQNRLGMLYTERQMGEGYNRVGGLDSRFRLNEKWSLVAQAIESDTRKVDGTRQNGAAWNASLTRSSSDWGFAGTYEDYAPGFQTDLGFVPRVDIRKISEWTNYRWRPNGSCLVSFGPVLSSSRTWNHQGQTQDWWLEPGFDVELMRQTYLHVGHSSGYERYRDLDFRPRYSYLSASSDLFPWLALSASYGQGTGINYVPATGLQPFLAERRLTTAGFTLRPGDRCIWENTYIRSQLAQKAEEGGSNIYDNHILRSKLNYQFTKAFSLRVILDYATVLPDPSLIQLDRTKRLGTDVLLAYLLHPGTAFYLGYTDAKENWALDPNRNPAIRTDSASLQTGRQFYLKLSYLFRT